MKAFYLLVVMVLAVIAAEKYRAMPFLVLVLATGIYGVAQGGSLPWTGKEFNTGFGQTMAAAGLALVAGAMVARLGAASGGVAWWRRRATRLGLPGMAVLGALAGLGGTQLGALAVLSPVVQGARSRARIGLMACFAVNAGHGCLVPSPILIAALAILGGDWRQALLFGLLVAGAQLAVGLVLARRCYDIETTPKDEEAPPSGRAGLGLGLAIVVMIGLIIGQSLGQIPTEPLGGGTIRENYLGLGRPMILILGGLGVALLVMGQLGRHALSDDGWVGQGARSCAGILLALGAAGGFQMVLHNNGMADMLAERLLDLPPGLGVAVPFAVALVNRALQGSPLTAAITAAGMIQPLLLPLGLDGTPGRALAALAVGAGVTALPHVNDGYFWLSSHLAGLRPLEGLRRITLGSLLQALAGLATLSLLAAIS
ncbi:GntT/GntP/DsdX family permease [Paramagnetospirillum kuznetsovii]|nr:hypothetical protein [Paramagnetospirillum kuznetsovii]